MEQRAAMTWARRLKGVFRIDITECERCQGPVKIIASIEDPVVINMNWFACNSEAFNQWIEENGFELKGPK